MNVSITAITLHTREQVEAIMDEAREIADGLASEGDGWSDYFAAAVALLGARHVIETHTAPVSLPALGNFGRAS